MMSGGSCEVELLTVGPSGSMFVGDVEIVGEGEREV